MLVHKIKRNRVYGLLTVTTLLALGATKVDAATIDFEGLSDSTTVTAQYPGLTFTNAIVLTAGISLNEFEFPPRSGTNVLSDNGGIITITFAAPVTSFSGYFTYLTTLTLTAFGASSNQLGQTGSSFSSNLALSGDPGSSPNEFLTLTFASGISSVTIAGDPAGGSFVLDDLMYQAATIASPEPTSLLLLATGLVTLALLKAS